MFPSRADIIHSWYFGELHVPDIGIDRGTTVHGELYLMKVDVLSDLMKMV